MPSNVSLKQYVHGGTNHSNGNTNEASAMKAHIANGHHGDIEYAMPVVANSTEIKPWLNTHQVTTVHGQGSSWNQPGASDEWGLKMYSTNAASNGYTNNYQGNANSLMEYANSGPTVLNNIENPTGVRIGAYFKTNSAGVGGMIQMFMFGQGADGNFNNTGHNHGYATTDGSNYVTNQAGTYGKSSKATSIENPASVSGKTYYSIRFLVNTTWTFHQMHVIFNSPGFAIENISWRIGFKPTGTNGSTANWDANGSQGEYLLIDKLQMHPFHISTEYAFLNKYGSNSDIRFSEIENDSGAGGSGAGGGS